MSESVEFISFHVSEDFKLQIGSDGKKFNVPRMKFLTGEKFFKLFAELQAKDVRGAIDILLKVKNGDKGIVADIGKSVSSLIHEKNFGMLFELLETVSEGVLTEKIIRELKCQYDEILKILIYLVDNNFSSLKNLSASLKAITSSGQ